MVDGALKKPAMVDWALKTLSWLTGCWKKCHGWLGVKNQYPSFLGAGCCQYCHDSQDSGNGARGSSAVIIYRLTLNLDLQSKAVVWLCGNRLLPQCLMHFPFLTPCSLVCRSSDSKSSDTVTTYFMSSVNKTNLLLLADVINGTSNETVWVVPPLLSLLWFLLVCSAFLSSAVLCSISLPPPPTSLLSPSPPGLLTISVFRSLSLSLSSPCLSASTLASCHPSLVIFFFSTLLSLSLSFSLSLPLSPSLSPLTSLSLFVLPSAHLFIHFAWLCLSPTALSLLLSLPPLSLFSCPPNLLTCCLPLCSALSLLPLSSLSLLSLSSLSLFHSCSLFSLSLLSSLSLPSRSSCHLSLLTFSLFHSDLSLFFFLFMLMQSKNVLNAAVELFHHVCVCVRACVRACVCVHACGCCKSCVCVFLSLWLIFWQWVVCWPCQVHVCATDDNCAECSQCLGWWLTCCPFQYKIPTVCFNSISGTAPQYLSDLLQP